MNDRIDEKAISVVASRRDEGTVLVLRGKSWKDSAGVFHAATEMLKQDGSWSSVDDVPGLDYSIELVDHRITEEQLAAYRFKKAVEDQR